MKVNALLTWALLAITFCRFFLARDLEITPKEAVYWMESSRLQGWFQDHGPLIPALMKGSTLLLGHSPLGLRLANPLLILFSSFLLYLLGRSICHQTVARWAVILFNLTPWVNQAAIYRVEDAHLICGGLGTAWLMWSALHRARWWHPLWLALGALLGLSFLASHQAIFFLLAIGLSLLLAKRWHRQWTRPGVYLMAMVAVLFVMISSRLGSGIFSSSQLLGLAFRRNGSAFGVHHSHAWVPLACLGLFGPILLMGLALAVRACARQARTPGGHGLALLLSWTVAGILAALGMPLLFGQAGVSGAFALGPCLILLVNWWTQLNLPLPRKHLWRNLATISTAALCLISLNTDILRAPGIPWPYRLDPTSETRGWQESASALRAALRQVAASGSAPVFVVASDTQSAAALEFALGDAPGLFRPSPQHPKVHVSESPSLEAPQHLWPSYSSPLFRGKNALVLVPAAISDPPPEIHQAFEKMELASAIVVTRNGHPLRHWSIFHAYRYNGLPL